MWKNGQAHMRQSHLFPYVPLFIPPTVRLFFLIYGWICWQGPASQVGFGKANIHRNCHGACVSMRKKSQETSLRKILGLQTLENQKYLCCHFFGISFSFFCHLFLFLHLFVMSVLFFVIWFCILLSCSFLFRECKRNA